MVQTAGYKVFVILGRENVIGYRAIALWEEEDLSTWLELAKW